jgi:hypothetical protein
MPIIQQSLPWHQQKRIIDEATYKCGLYAGTSTIYTIKTYCLQQFWIFCVFDKVKEKRI